MNWSEEVAALIAKSGKTIQEVADAVGIPKRTVENWKYGKVEPANISKYAFRDEMFKLSHPDRYTLVSTEKAPSVPSILIKSAKNPEDAIEQVKKVVEVLEVINLGEKFSKHYLPHKMFVLKDVRGRELKAIAIK